MRSDSTVHALVRFAFDRHRLLPSCLPVTRHVRRWLVDSWGDRLEPADAIVTITFDELGGRTTVTTAVLYESREARDGVLESPLGEGVAAGHDHLAGCWPQRGRAVSSGGTPGQAWSAAAHPTAIATR